MSANLENSAVATGLEKVSFIPIPKKGNAKECSNYRTIALISHTSKVILMDYCHPYGRKQRTKEPLDESEEESENIGLKLNIQKT